MSNKVIILAGGVGSRMGAPIPKQFIEVNDKPIIVHTIEVFNNHPEVDEIYVVCHADWVNKIKEYKHQFSLSKLSEDVVLGGKYASDSIFNGLRALEDKVKEDDVVLLHESVRPMVSEEIISDAIKVAKENGNAFSCFNCYESFIYSTDGVSGNEFFPRHHMFAASNPHALRGDTALEVLHTEVECDEDYIHSIYDYFVLVNKRTYISLGDYNNIKLTNQRDLDLFKYHLSKKEGK